MSREQEVKDGQRRIDLPMCVPFISPARNPRAPHTSSLDGVVHIRKNVNTPHARRRKDQQKAAYHDSIRQTQRQTLSSNKLTTSEFEGGGGGCNGCTTLIQIGITRLLLSVRRLEAVWRCGGDGYTSD